MSSLSSSTAGCLRASYSQRHQRGSSPRTCQPISHLSTRLNSRPQCSSRRASWRHSVNATSGEGDDLAASDVDSKRILLPEDSQLNEGVSEKFSLDDVIAEQLEEVENAARSKREGQTWLEDCVVFSEERDGGKKYLEVMVTSVHQVDHGLVAGLLCTPANKGAAVEKCREFPLFLNALTAGPVQEAVQRGGLPHAFEALPNLSQLDLQTALIHSFSSPPTDTATFILLDERSGEIMEILSTYHQAMGVALRYRLPIRIDAGAVAECNRDFLNRMLLNPAAREKEDDAELISGISSRLEHLLQHPRILQHQLEAAIAEEEYSRAASTKLELQRADRSWGSNFFTIMKDVRELYLQRMSVFFKL